MFTLSPVPDDEGSRRIFFERCYGGSGGTATDGPLFGPRPARKLCISGSVFVELLTWSENGHDSAPLSEFEWPVLLPLTVHERVLGGPAWFSYQSTVWVG